MALKDPGDPEYNVKSWFDPTYFISGWFDNELVDGAVGTTYNVDLTETVAAADSIAVTATFVGSLTESGSAADSQTGLATFVPALTETGAAADTETGLATFVSSLTETGAASDSQTGLATFVSALTESGSASDSSTGLATWPAALTETLSASDTEDATVTPAGVVYDVDLTETVAASDSQTGIANFASAISESGSVLDTIIASADFAGSLTDTLAALDAETGVFPAAYNVSVDEALAALDTSDTESAQTIGGDGAFLPIRGRNRQKATPKAPEKKQEAKPTPAKPPRRTSVVFEAAVSETISISDGQTCEVVRAYVESDISVGGSEGGSLVAPLERGSVELGSVQTTKPTERPDLPSDTPALPALATETGDLPNSGIILPKLGITPQIASYEHTEYLSVADSSTCEVIRGKSDTSPPSVQNWTPNKPWMPEQDDDALLVAMAYEFMMSA